jgi:hypothetical protein
MTIEKQKGILKMKRHNLVQMDVIMKMNYTAEERRAAAENTLYLLARGYMNTSEAKARCVAHGFEIDFRQADIGAYFEALDIVTGEFIELEV